MNAEYIPAEYVEVLPSGADWQSRHLESERRKAEIRDRIHKQTDHYEKTAKDYFRPAKPTPYSIVSLLIGATCSSSS